MSLNLDKEWNTREFQPVVELEESDQEIRTLNLKVWFSDGSFNLLASVKLHIKSNLNKGMASFRNLLLKTKDKRIYLL